MVITAGAEAASSARAHKVDPSTLDAISAAQDDLDRLSDALSAKMSDLHDLQDKFEAAVAKQAKMLKSINSTRKSAQSVADRIASSPSSSSPSSSSPSSSSPQSVTPSDVIDQDPNSEAAIDARVDILSKRLHDRQLLMPSTGGMFVELFLGSINVRFQRKSERLAFKKEYEVMKLKVAPIFVFFCIICLILADYRWLHMILQLALSCYYVTLAIRENILKVNGSNIRAWWIIHHYFTMMQGVLLLTWPNTASYVHYRTALHFFGLYNAVVMIFQTRYQMARLYTLRSLGMAHEMDVASSDNTQIHWSETMTLLLPLVVFGQFMQGYQALHLFKLYRNFPNEHQILFLSILFFANFIGNTTTTMQVVRTKSTSNRPKASFRPRHSRNSSISTSSNTQSTTTATTATISATAAAATANMSEPMLDKANKKDS